MQRFVVLTPLNGPNSPLSAAWGYLYPARGFWTVMRLPSALWMGTAGGTVAGGTRESAAQSQKGARSLAAALT
jgi:hypothetical protein